MYESVTFIKKIGLVGIANFVISLRGLILLPILTKNLGAAGYGIWAQILATVSLVMPFITLGLPSAMVRFLSSEKNKKEAASGIFTVIFSVFLLSVIFALLLFCFSEQFALSFLKNSSASIFIKIASLLLVLEAVNKAGLETFRIFGHIKEYSVLNILQAVLEIGLVASLVLSGWGLAGALTAFLAARAVIIALSLFFILSRTGFALPRMSTFKTYLIFGFPLIMTVIFEIITSSSDRYVIGFFHGETAVGIYSAAYGLGLMAAISLYPITYILAPTIFKLFDESQIEKVKNYLSYSLKYFLMLAVPSVFSLSILAGPILNSLTTSEFVSSSSTFVVLIVSLSMLFEGIRAIYGTSLMLFKKTKILGVSAIIAGIANLLLNIIFVPRFGIASAAITTLVAYIILGCSMYYYSKKYISFAVDWKFISKVILASIVMVCIIFMIKPVGWLSIVFCILTGIVIYFLMLFTLQCFNNQEAKIFAEVFKIKI